MLVPYFDLKQQFSGLRDEIMQALEHACSDAAFVLGEEVAEFEKEFAAYCEAGYCVALNSGTSALHVALLALGVKPGDEVITTPNSFIATASAITYVGATPVFVDIDPKTANLDPALIDLAITERTTAIIPVHLYGRPADMEPILEIASKHNLAVIEDACQAHGARYRGKRVGSIGHAATFSFYPSKNLSAYGEGGALTTNDPGIAKLARSLRNHGMSGPYTHERIGYNYRMEGFQGAVLRIKLKRIEQWNARRKEIADLYSTVLQGSSVEILRDDPRDERVYHLFTVYVDRRDAVRAALEARGVHTAIHYPCPIHLQPAFATLGLGPGRFPHVERACARVLSMPFFPELADEQVRYAGRQLADVSGGA
jgi:dTDP-4-amino-4,6-dideoxygalactose transaminase